MKVFFNDYISILLHQTDLTLTSYIKAKLASFNIAPEQNLVLMLLWETDGLTQNEIARRLDKDKTNITRMLHSLEKKGFIMRRVNEGDNRSFRISLTEAGKQLGKQVIPIAEEFNQIVCTGISPEELAAVRVVLQKMQQNVKVESEEVQ